MTETKLPTRVLIIGGGLAGLSLGQGLKKANISFHIFERDTSAGFRAQGNRIRIGSDGADGLKQLLPDNLYKAFEASAPEPRHGSRRLDASTGKEAESERRMPAHTGRAYNIDRAVVRDILLYGLEDHISFDRRFERYDVLPHGEIEVYFTDGSTERGTILVGADGTRSLVRQQLIPGMDILDTEGRAIFGKTPIVDNLLDLIPEQISQGICVAVDSSEERLKLFTDIMAFHRSQASDLKSSIGVSIPEDYIYWVLVFYRDNEGVGNDKTLHSLSSDQSAEKAKELTTGWHESVRTIIENQAPDATSTLAFLISPTTLVSQWDLKPAGGTSHITLIGDSAHPMPPVGGVGANNAFIDAAELYQTLCEFEKEAGYDHQAERIHGFEKRMIERAKIAIDRSAGGGRSFFGMKPVEELKPAVIWHSKS